MAVGRSASPPGAGSKKSLFRALAVLLPLAALAVGEIALRLAGYGYTTSFFKTSRIEGHTFLVENDAFGYRFFPRDLARMPLTLRMAEQKAPGTYRIFILGESAAMGDPEPEFGAGRYLAALLQERYPQAHFEVVNTAMTAINSHAILPIARDCARQDGDLWILYIGNNEMVGPFGAATVFGPQAPPLTVVRWYLACQRLRSAQLLLDLGRRIRGGAAATSWTGMQMFLNNRVAPEAPARQMVYRNFQHNLRDIVQTALGSGAAVVLSTVAVNLRDCPPFASSRSASAPDRAAADMACREGQQAEQAADFARAAIEFEKASRLDPGNAEVQYRWAEALLRSGRPAVARQHYQAACDLDALPFRATSRLNQIIQEVGRQLAGTNLDVIDVVPLLETNTTAGACGQETFHEHVHFNLDGNYRLARAWAAEVEKLLPSEWRRDVTANWASQERCEGRLGLTDWDRHHVVADILQRRHRPPLSGQSNNDLLVRELTATDAELKRAMDSSDGRKDARECYLEALRLAPDDYLVRENFAEFLAATGDLAGAVDQWQQVRQLIPQDHAPLYQLGRLAAARGQFSRAQELLAQTVVMRPSFAPGWFELGSARAACSNYDSAVAAFDRALRFDPQNAKCWFADGLALAMLGRRPEAIAHYREAARLDPADWKSHFELGGLLGLAGKMVEAKTESELAVRLNPAFPTSHLNLGLALVQLGNLDEAQRQFEETLRLDPGNAKAADYVVQVKALKKNRPE